MERQNKITRREFLIGGGLLTTAARRFISAASPVASSTNVAICGSSSASRSLEGLRQMAQLPPMPPAPPLFDPERMAAFVDPLPIPEISKPAGRRLNPSRKAHVPFYKISIQEFFFKVHRDIPPTRFWGYGGSVPGPTIEARTGEDVLIEWANLLPAKHFLPIDHNLMGAEKGRADSRAVVHVHGAKVPPESDGWPEDSYPTGGSATYYYPNEQEAALLWYHDHAMGINRLNIFAGMAGLYVIRDSFEDSLNLPKGDCEIPLVLMDRMIRKDGQLYYPVTEFPNAPWVPEYFGNASLMNGKLLPYLNVLARKYRFRILNASNARFYSLSIEDGLPFQQIGTDQGLLRAPAKVNRLEIAPGERADVIVDFAAHRGKTLLLNNLSSRLMQFRVAPDAVEDPSALPAALRAVPRLAETDAVQTRRLSLLELDNDVGDPAVHLLDGKRWHDPVSEKPVLDTTEIWELLNITDDSHPIHLHLVRFQILDRRPIDVSAYAYHQKLIYMGDPVPPDPNEAGWKDTVRATPGASTRIIVKFEGYAGRYVWHCHILEHEDNEMMRPYHVIAANQNKINQNKT